MNSARTAFGIKSKFVVHNLSVQGETAVGTIEPYPAGSADPRTVTWVLWKHKWVVVDKGEYSADTEGVAPEPNSSPGSPQFLSPQQQLPSDFWLPPQASDYTPYQFSPYLWGDANGDGDYGPLYPYVPAGANPSPYWTGQNFEWHWVDGYFRADGTYVPGYWRRTE